jgi:hypothetical protein
MYRSPRLQSLKRLVSGVSLSRSGSRLRTIPGHPFNEPGPLPAMDPSEYLTAERTKELFREHQLDDPKRSRPRQQDMD